MFGTSGLSDIHSRVYIIWGKQIVINVCSTNVAITLSAAYVVFSAFPSTAQHSDSALIFIHNKSHDYPGFILYRHSGIAHIQYNIIVLNLCRIIYVYIF